MTDKANWRTKAGTTFSTEKRSAIGSKGMIVTNNPLGSAAGAEMFAAGGNAIDAVITTSLAQIALATGAWVSYAGIFEMMYYDAASGYEPKDRGLVPDHTVYPGVADLTGDTDAVLTYTYELIRKGDETASTKNTARDQ